MNLFRRLSLALVVFGSALNLVAVTPDEVIAKARAFIGAEAKLDGITSVHFKGRLQATDNDGEGVDAAIELIFTKDFRQRVEVRYSNRIEVTALDDYEAWQRIRPVDDERGWRMSLLGANRIKQMRANTWANVSYFKGIEREGGKVTYEGETTVDGKKAHKLIFSHGPGLTFVRYFDVTTGQLLLTEAENGSQIREEGSTIVDGIRFPQKLITTAVGPDGVERSISVVFDQVFINESFPPALFAVPGFGS